MSGLDGVLRSFDQLLLEHEPLRLRSLFEPLDERGVGNSSAGGKDLVEPAVRRLLPAGASMARVLTAEHVSYELIVLHRDGRGGTAERLAPSEASALRLADLLPVRRVRSTRNMKRRTCRVPHRTDAGINMIALDSQHEAAHLAARRRQGDVVDCLGQPLVIVARSAHGKAWCVPDLLLDATHGRELWEIKSPEFANDDDFQARLQASRAVAAVAGWRPVTGVELDPHERELTELFYGVDGLDIPPSLMDRLVQACPLSVEEVWELLGRVHALPVLGAAIHAGLVRAVLNDRPLDLPTLIVRR